MAENLKQIIEFQAKGIERLKGQYKDLERRTKGLEGSTGRASGAMGGMIAKLGLTTVALYGTMRAISAVVRVGKEFEKNMSNVAAISGASGAELAALEKNAQKLGETTVFTASNVASLQVEFAKLGFSAKEITGVTKDTLALASATGSDLATSAAVAGQTLRAFGLDVNETSRITDTMAASFSASALDMDKFTNSMQYVAPIAKQIGIDVEGTTAILGTLANAGISGSMAGTSLRKILLELGNESSALTKKIGFSVKNSDDLTRAFAKLNTMGLGTAEMKDLVGQRAISAFNILLEGTSTTSKLTEELRNSSGAAQDMADVQLDNLEGKMTLLNSATEGLGIALFDLADDSISSVVTALTSLASVMTTVIKFGLGGLQKASEDTSDALSQMMIQTNEQAFEFKQLTTELLGLTKQTDLSNRQLARRNEIGEQLKSQFPNYLGNLDVEKQGYTDIAREISRANIQLKEYHEQLLKEATAAKFRDEMADTISEIAKLETRIEGFESGRMVDEFLTTETALLRMRPELEKAESTLAELQLAYDKASKAATSFGLVLAPTADDQAKLNNKAIEFDATLRKIPLDDTAISLNNIKPVTAGLTENFENLEGKVGANQYTLKSFKENLDQAAASAIFSAGSITSTSDALFASEQAAKKASIAFIQAEIQKAVSSFISSQIASAGALGWLVAPLAIAGGAAFGSLMGSAIQRVGAETGYSGVVDKPTMFMTGENNKAEQVSITPLESPNIGGAQGTGGITINVNAPMLDEHVLDTLVPAIERAKSANLA